MKNYIIVAIIIILIIIGVVWYKANNQTAPVAPEVATTTESGIPAVDNSVVPAPAEQGTSTDAAAGTTTSAQ